MSGNLGYGNNESGKYKNIKIVIFTGKSFEKQFYFYSERYELHLNNADGKLKVYLHKLNHDKKL